jgi:hypothetical protein
VRSSLVRPTSRKLDIDFPRPINRTIFDLNPPEFTLAVGHQVERTMFGQWHKKSKPLLEQIDLSLQDTQVALRFGVMLPCH